MALCTTCYTYIRQTYFLYFEIGYIHYALLVDDKRDLRNISPLNDTQLPYKLGQTSFPSCNTSLSLLNQPKILFEQECGIKKNVDVFKEIELQNTMNMLYAIQDVTWVMSVVYVQIKIKGTTNANIYHHLLIIDSVVITLSISIS